MVARGVGCAVIGKAGSDQSIAEQLAAVGGQVVIHHGPRDLLPEEAGKRFAGLVVEQAPDVCFFSVCNDVHWLGLPFIGPDFPTLAIAHADSSFYYDRVRHYAPLLDGVVGVSRETHRQLVGSCGFDHERAFHIPYGVPLVKELGLRPHPGNRATPKPALRIGYVGRILQHQKRILDLVPLVGALAGGGVPFEFDIVGDGPDRQLLERELLRSGRHSRVRFHGWLTPEAVQERLRQLDAIVLTSAYEGLPLVLLEAMSLGVVPVVSRTASGHDELVLDGETGYLVSIGDIAGFARRLETLQRDPELRHRMSLRAMEVVQHFSLEAMTDRYMEAAASVRRLSHRPRPAPNFPLLLTYRSRYPRWLRHLKRRLGMLKG